MSIRQQVESWLGQLGATADEVASNLLSLQIRGVRNTVRHLNPIIRYLQTRFATEAIEFNLMRGDAVTVRTESGTYEVVHLPDAVFDFLTMFHRGEFPALEVVPDARLG